MIMNKILFVLITIVMAMPFVNNAQSKRGKVWVTGSGISYKIYFERNGIVNSTLDTIFSPYFSKGNSNICDTNGNLVHFTHGLCPHKPY